MKRFFYKVIILTLLAGIVVACGGSGSSGFAGIGGSGYISSGSVSGFGSVFVNGVEFNTDAAVFRVEDTDGSQLDLRIGMVVQVKGSINADGVSGTATFIRYGDQLEGPVAAAPVANLDGTAKSFQIMGTPVIADAVDTVYEGIVFANLAKNNLLEVSGYYDQNDVLHATYIKLIAVEFNPKNRVEIEGSISQLRGKNFILRNVNVNAVSANISGMINGLQNGDYVEVKGLYDRNTNTLTASEVEAEKIEFSDDGSEVSLEGFITRYVSNSDFDINGFKVNAATATMEPATLVLRAGIKVEVEGVIIDGILNAKKIETSHGEAKIFAFVKTVNSSAGTFTLDVARVTNQPLITVSVNTSTTLEDDLLGLEPFRLVNLAGGEFVEVVGFESDTGSVTATKVKRLAEVSDIVLQGNATSATGDVNSGTITILGVTFQYNGDTAFENEADESLNLPDDIDALIATINATPTLVKINDTNEDGIADEIDLEDD